MTKSLSRPKSTPFHSAVFLVLTLLIVINVRQARQERSARHKHALCGQTLILKGEVNEMKRIILFLSAAALLCTLAGCSGGGQAATGRL
jgi:hypothetical protein